MYTQISQCRICKGSRLVPQVDLGHLSLTGLFPKDDTEVVPRGPLLLIKCQDCDLVQLGHSYDLNQLYGQNYGYRSGLNGSMVRHLNSKVYNIIKRVDLSPDDLIIDIGSNDSTTLRAYPNLGLQLIGVDPSGAKFKSFYPSDVQLIADFFSAKRVREGVGDKKAKVITSFAMFYDLEDPTAFMKEVADLLTDDGIWVFEQSYLKSMIDTNSYDTICHEHLEYYGLKQIHWMTEKVGLKILDVEFNDVNGGSFSVAVTHKKSRLRENESQVNQILLNEEKSGLFSHQSFKAFNERTQNHRKTVRNFFQKMEGEGKKVLGYGASTKGNVLLQFCGVTSKDLPCIAEVNEDKFGAFTPGTCIPIVSEASARQMNPDVYFVLPWHFRSGILQREKAFLESGGKFVFPLPQLEIV